MCPFVVRNRCKQSNVICEKGMYKNEITIVFSAKIKWQQVHAFSVWTLNKFSHAWQKALFSTFSLFILSLCISFVAQVWILSCLELSPAVDSDSNLIKSYFMLQCPLFIIFLMSQFHPLLLFFFSCLLLFLLLQSFLSVSAFLPTIQMAQRIHDVLSLCAGGGTAILSSLLFSLLSFCYCQDDWTDVWYFAVMGDRTDVCAAACYDETSLAGLPQLGPEGCGSDEEGSWTDKYCGPAEDGGQFLFFPWY